MENNINSSRSARVLLLWLCLVLFGASPRAQSLFGTNDFVEYIPGSLPIILVAPHGGDMRPSEIPNRSCAGCVTSNDLNTQELGRAAQAAIERVFGCKPHLIINRLHRSKMDANRAIGEAANGDPLAEQAWGEFHGFIAQAKKQVDSLYGQGLLIDLHGHGHSIQRLEIGYLLSKSDLQLSNAAMDTDPEMKAAFSMRALLETSDTLRLSHLIRGPNSLGSLFDQKGFPSVPSPYFPFPETNEPYFSGGYNTLVYGSSGSGNIDAVQIECNLNGVRDTEFNRQDFASALATILQRYFELFYPALPGTAGFCGDTNVNTTTANQTAPTARIFPNPGGQEFELTPLRPDFRNWTSLQVFDASGRKIAHQVLSEAGSLPLRVKLPHATPGMYFVRVTDKRESMVLPYIIQPQ